MNQLYDLYKLGRSTRTRTLSRGMIKTGPNGRPVIVTITDMNGKPAGEYWISDIEGLVQSAKMMGDTPATNPNIIVVKAILQDMINTEKGYANIRTDSLFGNQA